MRKFLIILVCLIGVEFIFLNVTSAELRHFDTDKNGYKTYFDTDSLGVYEENGEKILEVRVVGLRPDNSVILDTIEYFKAVNNELYYCFSQNKGEWRKAGKQNVKLWEAILDYADEVAGSSS